MALDIKPDDFLIVGDDEYPIRAVNPYSVHGFGVSASFTLRAEVDCYTKRIPAVSGGKRGEPRTHLTGLKCTQIDPINPETRFEQPMRTPIVTFVTYISNGDDFSQLILNERREQDAV